MCPVRALAHRYIHLCTQDVDLTIFLSAYYDDCGKHSRITNEDISTLLKAATTVLEYPTAKGIPINQIETHSLRSEGANALSLTGYSDTQIQKMGGTGMGLHLKNTSGKNWHWHFSWRECQQA
jgi:hypothetical protein